MEQTNETINNSMNTEEGKEEQADTMGILDKFCWPGFLMPQFWGIGNGMPVGIIAFIPVFTPIMSLVFGFGGYRTAYVKMRKSKMEFYDLQTKWQKAAIIYIGALLSLLLLLVSGRVINYVSNKNEVAGIVKEYEAKKEQTIEKAETLLEEENLKKYIGDFDFVPESELEISENGNLWHIQNGYRYQELSERIIDFREDMPYITKVTQYFSIGDGWMIWMSLSVDENFDITESKFYILAPEEAEAMYGSGLSIDGSRWMEYMDRETMDRILRERE